MAQWPRLRVPSRPGHLREPASGCIREGTAHPCLSLPPPPSLSVNEPGKRAGQCSWGRGSRQGPGSRWNPRTNMNTDPGGPARTVVPAQASAQPGPLPQGLAAPADRQTDRGRGRGAPLCEARCWRAAPGCGRAGGISVSTAGRLRSGGDRPRPTHVPLVLPETARVGHFRSILGTRRRALWCSFAFHRTLIMSSVLSGHFYCPFGLFCVGFSALCTVSFRTRCPRRGFGGRVAHVFAPFSHSGRHLLVRGSLAL